MVLQVNIDIATKSSTLIYDIAGNSLISFIIILNNYSNYLSAFSH